MSYLISIQQAIDYIEDNLREYINPEGVAQEAAYSLFYFHRIFQAVVGDSVMGYIRGRRLSEAAYELAKTDRRILDIALDYQYESQESFTRAFKKMYGMNPGEYRRRKQYYPLMTRFSLVGHTQNQGGTILEPKIVMREEFVVIGMEYVGDNANNEIGRLWEGFFPRVSEISDRVDQSVLYGVCGSAEEKVAFSYVAGAKVASGSDVPSGMVKKTIPAGKYLVYTHVGPLKTFMDTNSKIFGEWLPESGFEPAGLDFEVYDERFNEYSDKSEIDVCVLVK